MGLLGAEQPVKEFHGRINLGGTCRNRQTIVALIVDGDSVLLHLADIVYIDKEPDGVFSKVVFKAHVFHVIIQGADNGSAQPAREWRFIVGAAHGVRVYVACVLPSGEVLVTVDTEIPLPSFGEIGEALVA